MKDYDWQGRTASVLGVFAGLAFLVQIRLMAPLDAAALQWVVACRPASLSEPMNWVFRLGFAQVDTGIAVLWACVLFIVIRRTSSDPDNISPVSSISESPRHPRFVPNTGLRFLLPTLAPLVLLLLLGIQVGLRLAIDQPAPAISYELERPSSQSVGSALDRSDATLRESILAANIPPSGSFGDRGSFPSGHACRALFLALLAQRLGRASWRIVRRILWSTLLMVLAGLVGYSALYFGYHWPSDVLGGYLLALAAYPLAAKCLASDRYAHGAGRPSSSLG